MHKSSLNPLSIDRRFLLVLPFITALIILFGFQFSVQAKPGPDGLAVEVRSTTQLFMDDNKFCASRGAEGPDGGWYHLVITNTEKNQTYTGLQLTLTSPNGVAIEDGVRYLGSLPPNQKKDIFFFVDYSQLRNDPSCNNLVFEKPFTVTIESINHGMNGTKVYNNIFSDAKVKNAGVGGQYLSHQLGPGAYVGQILTMTVLYSYGKNDPNSSLFIQPSGNSDFNDQCYRLVGSRVLASEVSGVLAGATNQLWFGIVSTNPNAKITMEYSFEILCASSGTQSYPWSEITSGSSRKYNKSNFGGSGGSGAPLPSPQPITKALNISMSVTPDLLVQGGAATFTVRFENVVTVPIYLNTIHKNLPSGVAYAGVKAQSQVKPSNSSVVPIPGSTGSISWYGQPQSSYLVPAKASGPNGDPGILELVYTATITSSQGIYTSWATGVAGIESTNSVSATVNVENSPTAVQISSFYAFPQDAWMQVLWETAMEMNTQGFNLYRRADPEEAWQLINDTLIEAVNIGGFGITNYSWMDMDAQPGVFYEYILEEVEFSGKTYKYGPATTAPVPQAYSTIFLPVVQR